MTKLDPATLFLVGVLLSALSSVLVFGRGLRALPFVGLVAIAIAAPTALMHYLLEIPFNSSWVLSVGIAAAAFIMVVRTEYVTRAVARLAAFFRKPVVCGGLLFLAGLGVLGAACYQADLSDSDDSEEWLRQFEEEAAHDLQPFDELRAFTDRGNDLPLLQLANGKAEAVARGDQRLIANPANRDHLIRVAGASTQSNCHGWVFTGGLCWISGETVDLILLENGYQQVEIPASGDLVVYRNEQGKVVHSGIVRGVWSEGRILVESKWGTLGAFVHFVEQSIYEGHWTFHHANRPTHLLRGLPDSSGLTSTSSAKKS